MISIPINYHHQSYLIINPSNCSNAYCKKNFPMVSQWHKCNGLTNSFLIEFKAHFTGGNACLVLIYGQEAVVEELQTTGVNLPVTYLLNKYNIKLPFEFISF